MIISNHGKFEVRSEDGKKRLGSYPSKEQAVKRLQQIEWFKAHPKKGGK